jgi:hypothetical protein
LFRIALPAENGKIGQKPLEKLLMITQLEDVLAELLAEGGV